jgi:hypothetical protein
MRLPVQERGQGSKGLEGNEGNVFYAFQSKRNRDSRLLEHMSVGRCNARDGGRFRDGKANVHFTETSGL